MIDQAVSAGPADRVVPDRRFDPAEMSGRVAPFALGGGGAIGIALFGLSPRHPEALVVGVAVSALLLVLGVVASVKPLPIWLDPLMPLAGVAMVGLLRYGAGDSETGYSALVLIPILWLAMFGTRRQLGVGLLLATLVSAAPILLVGGSDYPPSEWRHVGVIVMLAVFVGLTTQVLVHDIRARGAIIVAREESLAEQAAVNRAIVDSAFDAIMTLDERGRIVEWNEAANSILGRRSQEAVGLDFIGEIVAPERRARVRDGLQRILAGERSNRDRRFETSIVRPDGRVVPVEVTTTTTNGASGFRIHAFARDISVRHVADEAAAQHLADLGRLLAVARELGRNEDGANDRAAICRAAQELAGADMALFFEARPEARVLVATGRSGAGPDPGTVVLSGRSSMTAAVFASKQAEFIPDLVADPRIDQRVVDIVNARSALFQPIVVDGQALGVLVVYWQTVLERLPARIASMIELFANQAATVVQRADLLTRLESLARTDALTGAANRRALEEAMVQEIAAAERSRAPLTIIMLDLDHFKVYNDTHGHQAGDRLLHVLVNVWRMELRPGDTLARYGGEEFVVVLPGCEVATALRIADRLRAAVPDDQTTSAGVAGWDGQESMGELIGRADAALYQAKGAGRDQAIVARTDAAPGLPDAGRHRRRPRPGGGIPVEAALSTLP